VIVFPEKVSEKSSKKHPIVISRNQGENATVVAKKVETASVYLLG
jgi:hypothetical protein